MVHPVAGDGPPCNREGPPCNREWSTLHNSISPCAGSICDTSTYETELVITVTWLQLHANFRHLDWEAGNVTNTVSSKQTKAVQSPRSDLYTWVGNPGPRFKYLLSFCHHFAFGGVRHRPAAQQAWRKQGAGQVAVLLCSRAEWLTAAGRLFLLQGLNLLLAIKWTAVSSIHKEIRHLHKIFR
jgi:hypothetical protein